MAKSKIEWTENTWNPTTGCTKISSGCLNCYAERMSFRLQKMGNPKYTNGFDVTIHPETIDEPYTWKKSKIVFVNSMSDLFHEDIPFSFIKKVFKTMNDNPNHIFQILTKRSEILEKYSTRLKWTPNIWIGVTVEEKKQLFRIDNLRNIKSSVRFISCEPLIEDLETINLKNIDWVIVGGESGPGSRLLEEQWVKNILKQCKSQRVPFFFKQWGGFNKKKNGKQLDGKTYLEMPKEYHKFN